MNAASSSDAAQLLDIATRGSQTERWRLAGDEHLPRAVFDVLANDPDEGVLSSLAGNYSCPKEILGRLAHDHPTLRSWVAQNPNAPSSLKEEFAVGIQSRNSIDRYLADKRASEGQRAVVLAAHRANPGPDGPHLGVIWQEAKNGDREFPDA